jgi:hypothetical protein
VHKGYESLKSQLLGLGLTLNTFLDHAPDLRVRQRHIAKILTDHKIDLPTLVDACRTRYPELAEHNSVRMSGELIVFRKSWQTRHLLSVIAQTLGVKDRELQGTPSNVPATRTPRRTTDTTSTST